MNNVDMDAIRRYRARRLLRLIGLCRYDGWNDVPYGLLDVAGIAHDDNTVYSEAWKLCERIGLDKSCVQYNDGGIVVEIKPKVKLPNGKKGQLDHTPWKYRNVKFGEVDDNKGHNIDGFTQKFKEKKHIDDHAKELGITPEQYVKNAHKFLEKPLTRTMEEMTVEGRVGYIETYRYDYSTEEFGVINANGFISTYYSMDKESWEKLIDGNGLIAGGNERGKKIKDSKSNKKGNNSKKRNGW